MSLTSRQPELSEILGGGDPGAVRSHAKGPSGSLPLEPEMLLRAPSGDLFGLTQNVGMGWDPREARRRTQFLILSTQGGLRGEDGRPIALGYHTGHWEVGLLVRRRGRRRCASRGAVPFAGLVHRSVRRPHAGHAGR